MRFMVKNKKDQTFKGTINILGHKIVLLKEMKYQHTFQKLKIDISTIKSCGYVDIYKWWSVQCWITQALGRAVGAAVWLVKHLETNKLAPKLNTDLYNSFKTEMQTNY